MDYSIVINAVVVMLTVSLLFGLLIAIFAKVFEVKRDPRINEIIEALPGYNCGACGYPGCANYAEAIIENGDIPNKCKPGGADVAAAIKEILEKSEESEAAESKS